MAGHLHLRGDRARSWQATAGESNALGERSESKGPEPIHILRCCDGTFYIGHTNGLASREQVHNNGFGARYTAKRRPVRIV